VKVGVMARIAAITAWDCVHSALNVFREAMDIPVRHGIRDASCLVMKVN
jgi:hypothetical protein